MGKHVRRFLAVLVAVTTGMVVLGACSSEDPSSARSRRTTVAGATAVPTTRSEKATPVPDNRGLVAEAIQNLSAAGPYEVTIITTVKGEVTFKTSQQFSFDGPDRMVLKEETDRPFEVVANGSELFVRELGGEWRAPAGVTAEAYTSIAKLYDLSPIIGQRETRESYEGSQKMQLVSLYAGVDSVVGAAEKLVADNPSLKANLTQTKLSSIKMDYYVVPDPSLIKRAVLTVNATYNDKPVQTVVEFSYTYGKPFSFPDDSPFAGR